MAFDGFVTHSIVRELNSKLILGKIDKIYQPEKDEIIISVRTLTGNHRLLLSAASSNPRIHLTELSRQNPINAPLFCMILRKHLTGGKIINISQQDFDRVVIIDIECYTEMGDLTTKSIVIEIMGRHSNIILIKDDKKIIDSIKHIDGTVSAVRQVLPNLFYELPPKQEKTSPKSISPAAFAEKLHNYGDDTLLDKILLSEFMGMSPLTSREIVYRITGNTKTFLNEVAPNDFTKHTCEILADIINNENKASVVLDATTKKPVAFSCIKLSQYEGSGEVSICDSISHAVENFFASRDLQDRLVQKSSGITKVINNNIERCEKKIAIHADILEKSEKREQYKIFGDLLTANIYKIESGAESVSVTNYYSEENEEITISLQPELSPSANAQRYYKLYAKTKAAEQHAKEQLRDAEAEKLYLESVLDSVKRAETYQDISEIREELSEQGYISNGGNKNTKKKNKEKSLPIEFLSSDGYTILVGRNNKQNDELTIRMAFSSDIWLHTKIIPGSHTIIRTNQSPDDVPDNTILEAATIAAYFSKAQNSSGVPVDYTQIKNVKKPNGAKPGFVIYETNNTVYVTPDKDLVEKLKVKN